MIKRNHRKRIAIPVLAIALSAGLLGIFFPNSRLAPQRLIGQGGIAQNRIGQERKTTLSIIEFITQATQQSPKSISISTEFQWTWPGNLLGWWSWSQFTGNYTIQSNHQLWFEPFQETAHIQNDLLFSLMGDETEDFSFIYNNHFDTLITNNPNPQTPNTSYLYLNEHDLVQVQNPNDTVQLRFGLLNRFKDVWLEDTQWTLSVYRILESLSWTIRQLALENDATHIELHANYFSLLWEFYQDSDRFDGTLAFWSGSQITFNWAFPFWTGSQADKNWAIPFWSGSQDNRDWTVPSWSESQGNDAQITDNEASRTTGTISTLNNKEYSFTLHHATRIPWKTTGSMNITTWRLLNNKATVQIDATTQRENEARLESAITIQIEPKKSHTYRELPEQSISLQTIRSQLFE